MSARGGLAGLDRALLFGLALLASVALREGAAGHLTQAVIWLPSGVGVAGLVWLGPSAWWVVALTTVLQRAWLGHGLDVGLPAALGSTGEALLGALLLRRLGVRGRFERLGDVLGLIAVAMVAPLASIAASWVARARVWTDPDLPFYSGWDGWWRMNGLGILTVVPVAGAFRARPGPAPAWVSSLRIVGEVVVPTLALNWVVLRLLTPGPLGMVVLVLSLFLPLWGSVRHGPRGAIASASLTALAQALGTANGIGPFASVPLADRHDILQFFEFSLLALPLAVGALVAERQANASLLQWQARLLEEIAAARPTSEVARSVAEGIEARCEGSAGAVLVAEDGRLRVAAAPSLPPAVVRALEGPVGPRAGPWGASIHRSEPVMSPDVALDPLLEDSRGVLLAEGLRACWTAPIRGPQGPVLGTIALFHRERRARSAAELALLERGAVLAGLALDRERREELLRSLSRNVTDGLFRSTPRRGMLFANEAFARMFGYGAPAEVLRVPPETLFQQAERREELLRLVEERGAFLGEEVQLRRRDGSTFQGLVSWTGVRGVDGQLAFIDGAVSDITGRKALEEQLRQAQKMEALGKLAGGVAHDFNNLLTVITGFGENARDALPAGSEPRADLEEVLTGARRAAALTAQLLAYSRQQVLSPRVLDLQEALEGLGGMLRRLIGEHVHLDLAPAPGPLPVKVDRGQLEQVVMNLAVNARDAMPGGGALRLAAEAVEVTSAQAAQHPELSPGPHVALSVQDTGQGMPTEVRQRAFDPFFTTKEKGKGTGLGLSMVYGIVRQSGGAVWLDSRPGAGTTVWVYLPRAEATPEQQPPPPAVAGHGGAETVLVVEDEAVVRGLVVRTLDRRGYRVLEAADGVEALELSSRHPGPIEVVVTDVVMPRLGGRELVRELLAARPGLKVLMMSGYPDGAWEPGGPGPGAADFLQKPFSASELTSRLEALLARPG